MFSVIPISIFLVFVVPGYISTGKNYQQRCAHSQIVPISDENAADSVSQGTNSSVNDESRSEQMLRNHQVASSVVQDLEAKDDLISQRMCPSLTKDPCRIRISRYKFQC